MPAMSEKWQDDVTPALRRLQIIVAGIIAGCLVFLGVVLVIAKPPDLDRQPMLSYAALACAALAIVSRIVLVAALTTVGRRAIGRELPSSARDGAGPPADQRPSMDLVHSIWGLFTMRTICAAAILEGAAFFLAVAYLLEGFWPAPVAAGLLIVGLLLHVPTRSGMVRWSEAQLRLLDEERQMRA
jgi:hypothetical protein